MLCLMDIKCATSLDNKFRPNELVDEYASLLHEGHDALGLKPCMPTLCYSRQG